MAQTNSPEYSFTSIMESVGGLGLANGGSDSLKWKSCCGALYELEPVRLLLGDTLHPGGLALTHRLGKLVNILRDDLVLDVACGLGASSLAVARSFHCSVTGVEIGNAVVEATRLASETKINCRVAFIRGDAELMPLSAKKFDAVLCECSMSLFPDKAQGVAEMARVLRAGGRLGVSDVTIEPGCLPEELKGTLGQMLCLSDALSVEGYRELLSGGGLTLTHQLDASDSLTKLVGDIEAKLAAFQLVHSYQDRSGPLSEIIGKALHVVAAVKELVKEGMIGYWLYVAEKRA